MSFKCYDDNCSVCLEKVNLETDAILICGHKHHIDCLKSVSACPVCRVPLILLYSLFSKYKDEMLALQNANLESTRLYESLLEKNKDEEYYKSRFHQYPTLNPVTNFPIMLGGPTYKKLIEKYGRPEYTMKNIQEMRGCYMLINHPTYKSLVKDKNYKILSMLSMAEKQRLMHDCHYIVICRT